MIDQNEFIRLIQQHKAMLHKVCNVYCQNEFDRQDLFQEIVIQLWKSFPKFRGEAKFSTWLYRIALNTAISDLRRQKRNIILSDPDQLPVDIEDVRSYHQKEERFQQLYMAISQLTEIEKAIIMLYLEDKNYDEMEEILGIAQNNLRVKVNRIKEKLRKLTKAIEHGIG